MNNTENTLKFGDIILINYPSNNIILTTKRPFLVLEEYQNNLLVCAISSRIDHQEQSDIIIKSDKENQLVTTSLVKSRKIITISKSLIHKRLGTLKKKDKALIKTSLLELIKAL